MDFITILNGIPSGIYTLLGTALGFGLGLFKDWYENRNKLFYSLQPDVPYDDWEYNKSPATGPSGYLIKIYNCGRNPVILDDLSISVTGKRIDAVLMETVTILPYHEYECTLSKQDYEVLREWCTQHTTTVADITIRTIDEKKIIGKLDITFISKQAQFLKSLG